MAGNGSLFDLSGRVAVVTGGNRGIGHAMALGLARAGASVAVLARNAEQNQLVLAELKAIGKPALVLPLDVTDRPALAPADLGQQCRDRCAIRWGAERNRRCLG